MKAIYFILLFIFFSKSFGQNIEKDYIKLNSGDKIYGKVQFHYFSPNIIHVNDSLHFKLSDINSLKIGSYYFKKITENDSMNFLAIRTNKGKISTYQIIPQPCIPPLPSVTIGLGPYYCNFITKNDSDFYEANILNFKKLMTDNSLSLEYLKKYNTYERFGRISLITGLISVLGGSLLKHDNIKIDKNFKINYFQLSGISIIIFSHYLFYKRNSSLREAIQIYNK